MKKTLLSLLLVSLSLTMFFGCAEEKKTNPPANTAINFADVNTLKGNYTAEVFITEVTGLTFTNDCEAVKAMANPGAITCDTAKNVSLAAQAQITIRDGKPVLETKVQMWGGNFGEMVNTPGLGDLVKPNSYNYTRYNALTAVTGSDNNIDSYRTTSVVGRDFAAPSAFTNPEADLSQIPDGRLEITFSMTVMGMPAETSVFLKKNNDVVSSINPNTLVTNQGFVEGFVATELIAPLP